MEKLTLWLQATVPIEILQWICYAPDIFFFFFFVNFTYILELELVKLRDLKWAIFIFVINFSDWKLSDPAKNSLILALGRKMRWPLSEQMFPQNGVRELQNIYFQFLLLSVYRLDTSVLEKASLSFLWGIQEFLCVISMFLWYIQQADEKCCVQDGFHQTKHFRTEERTQTGLVWLGMCNIHTNNMYIHFSHRSVGKH